MDSSKFFSTGRLSSIGFRKSSWNSKASPVVAYHNCGFNPSGEVKCWGYGGVLECLGNGGTGDQSRPVGVILGKGSSSALSGVVDIARGSMAEHTCVQHGEGKLLCWGPIMVWDSLETTTLSLIPL